MKMNCLHNIYILSVFLYLLALPGIRVQAQNTIIATGIVRDSVTNEPIPFASVVFENSLIGDMTDDNGSFSLKNDKNLTQLAFSCLGYEKKTIILRTDRRNENLDIRLRPTFINLTEVVVKPTRERYSRRNNPAVDLIRAVIDRKDENRIEAFPEYKVEMYEKLSMALDNFNPNFDSNGFMQKLKFVKNYMDTSEFTGRPILTVSVRETLSDIYYRKDPRSKKTIVKGKQQQGIDETIDEGGITSNLEEFFQGINIFENNINFLSNRFVSPLSSLLATTYYHYYIMDTLDVGGDRCIDLAFVPVNSQSYGFTGRLYITLDNYSIKKFRLDIPRNINLNFVDNLRIEQEFKLTPDSTWVVDVENIYVNFYMMGQHLYAHQLRTFNNYNFEIAERDSIFALLGPMHILPNAVEQPDSFWIHSRHIPLKEKENVLNDLVREIRKVPVFNAIIKTAEILITGFIQTGPSKEENYFDIGPMNTVFSANQLEGWRIRVGGMTTANLFPHMFASGYVAYGMDDRKFKYSGKFTYSFDAKKYHEGEFPVNNLSLIQEYDVYTPGQDFLFTSKDNMFVALKVGEPVTNMNYVLKTMLQYNKDWLNGLSINTWIRRKNEEAAGTLEYKRLDANGKPIRIKSITSTETGLQIRFAPGERAYGGRKGKDSFFNMSKDAPVFKLSHQLGVKDILGSDYNYNRTEFSAEKRIWLSSFGHIDAQFKAGKIWNKVPFPLLVLPNTNQSLTIQPEAFHMMRALEFVADEYISLNATYYLKGWILNRIPGIRWLKFREVVSFNGIYGRLSNRNNPLAIGNSDLFMLPSGTSGLGVQPYMEASFGLENIFKILRIDYYHRLTYLDNPNIKRSGFRLALRFSF
ncbi:MAG: DUF5686 and carboxypeptidase regulatory-like domain-containing protein [Tannerellaceae bacterium]|jgi:hypothetical protein|nr:DUF5686 and carboxypeptidase regulatory-like domain-containing protein [Tannerellaceae bacterium]